MKTQKRKKIWVNREIQANYLLLLAGSGMILGIFFTFYFLYLNHQTLSSLKEFIMGNVLLEKYLITTERFLLVGSILLVILSGILLSILALLHSHKVAGPLFRIERIIQEMKEGKFPEKVILRKGDRLKKLAKHLEELSQEFLEKGKNLEKITQEIRGLLSEEGLEEKVRKKLTNIEKILTSPSSQSEGKIKT